MNCLDFRLLIFPLISLITFSTVFVALICKVTLFPFRFKIVPPGSRRAFRKVKCRPGRNKLELLSYTIWLRTISWSLDLSRIVSEVPQQVQQSVWTEDHHKVFNFGVTCWLSLSPLDCQIPLRVSTKGKDFPAYSEIQEKCCFPRAV